MKYLESNYFFDFNQESIQSIVSEFRDSSKTEQEKAIGLYLKVRDGWKYDPYHIALSQPFFRASVIAVKSSGNCVEKSILLIACLRAVGLPARLHLGKVKNHIAAERLMEKFGSDELTPHGMVNVYISGKWLKLSPAFNKSLCEKFEVEPLDFDGENHSFLQQYNSKGNLFMEYLDDYGHFEDVPLEFMKQNLKDHYPHIFGSIDHLSEIRL